MITLQIEPRIVKTAEEFFSPSFPGYSIALDGYVRGKPEFRNSREGPKLNLNHHEDVDRLGTRSTCAQAAISIKQGLYDIFRKDGEPHAILYANDCDQDVCLSTWFLQNHERIAGTKSEPLLTRILAVTDFLDATAGAYPISPDTRIRRELGWVYQPFTEARIEGRIPFMKEGEMRNVIDSVCTRISDYSLGKGGKITLDTRYEVLESGPDWQLVKEIGFDARSKMFATGVKAFIAVRDRGNGYYDYTYGKMSPFIDISLTDFYQFLNQVEGLQNESGNCHGGSDIVGGSPRLTGSEINPKEMALKFNEFLIRNKK